MPLSRGDLAFVQYGASTPDEFSFVALNNIAAGEAINFTDKGWSATGSFGTSEGLLTFTVPSGGLAAGQVVSWKNGALNNGSTTNGFSSNSPTNFNLSTNGDSLIAFQGTVASPTSLVAGLLAVPNSSGWATGGNDTIISSYVPGTNSSLPPLTDATYSVAISGSDGYFNPALAPTLTASNALTTINDKTNWITANADQPTQTYNFSAICYLAGTRIRTPAGDRAIETLAIGDEVTTIDGVQRIRWIGWHSYGAELAGPWVTPIRIKAHTFGPGLPQRDLLVSPWHAILFDDVMVRAADLVNRSTITQEFPGTIAHYFNIEFDAPTVVYAEGIAAETYANHDNRHMFENAADYAALYGEDDRLMVDAGGNGIRRFPLVLEGSQFEAARQRAIREQRAA